MELNSAPLEHRVGWVTDFYQTEHRKETLVRHDLSQVVKVKVADIRNVDFIYSLI